MVVSAEVINLAMMILRGKPRKNVFCGNDKYLKILKHHVTTPTEPIMEDDSYFLYVKQGRGQLIINGIPFDLQAGSICWIYCYHVVAIHPDPTAPLELWSCMYEYQLANYFRFRPSGKQGASVLMVHQPVVYPDGQMYDRMKEIILQLEHYSTQSDPGASLIKVSLIGQLAELYEQENKNQVPEQQRPRSWEVAQYIAATSTNPLTVTDVAMAFSITEDEVNRDLRMTTGMNFEQYLNRLRSICAASYLLYDDVPLDYIGQLAGFSCEKSFFRNFRKTMDMSPAEYRSMVTTGCTTLYRGLIYDEMLVSVVQYLYTHHSEKITVQQMEKDLFLSAGIIRKLLLDAFGVGFKTILAQMRVRYAESLLASTYLPLIDIALMVGFNSYTTFVRNFEQINRITPSAYRNRCHLIDGKESGEYKHDGSAS